MLYQKEEKCVSGKEYQNVGISHVIIAYNLLAYLSFSAQYDSNKGECMVIFICCCHLFFLFQIWKRHHDIHGEGLWLSDLRSFDNMGSDAFVQRS